MQAWLPIMLSAAMLAVSAGYRSDRVRAWLDPDSDLQGIGYPHQWRMQEGNHDFDFWNKAMPAALEWLAGRTA